MIFEMKYYPSCHPENCKECPLGKQEGIKVVRSILPSHAKVLFIGEGPGEVENEKGIPFVGKAGELLSQIMIEVGINRDDVAIANTVTCRPPDNRTPTTKEIKICSQFLHLEIASLKPSLIVPLGAVALKVIYPSLGTITKVRGKFVDHPELGCKILPAFHPFYILRNPTERHFLVDDLKKVSDFMHGKISIPEKQPTYYHTITTRKQLDWAVEQLHKNTIWACDTETTSVNQLEAEVFIITFSWKSHSAILMDSRLFKNDLEYFWAKVKEVMENNSCKIFHNGGYDIQCFINHGIQVQKYHADTILMYYMLTQTILPGLDKLTWDFSDLGGYDLLLERYKKENTINSYKDIPVEIIHPYACSDADVTLRSYLAMLPQIEKQHLSFVLFDIMIPTQKILLRAEYNGVSIDKNYLDKTIEKYTKKMQDQLTVVKNVPQVRQFVEDKRTQEKAILKSKWEKSKTLTKKYPGFEDYLQARLLKSPDSLTTEFNMNSPKQLKELLIDKMGLKIIKTTATGQPSVDGEVLEEYAKHNSFCNALQEYRTLSHLKSTFLVGILNRLTSQNKVHTDYFLCTTDTGRISSRDPNLANIPRTGTADDIKDIFCSDPGDWLMEADLAQAEFRCIEGSQKVLMEDFTTKPIKEIKKGDRVLAIDESPLKGSPRRKFKVAEVLKTHYQGKKECVRISSEENRIICTKDHKFLKNSSRNENYGINRWESLETNDLCYNLPISYIKNKKEYLEGMLFGLYLTDGHLKNDTDYPVLSICQSDKEIIDWVFTFLKDYGFSCKRFFDKHAYYISLSNKKEVTRFLKIFSKERSLDSQRGIVAGMILGDGWIGGDGWIRGNDKTFKQTGIGIGLSIVHPEVMEILYNCLNSLKNCYSFTYRVYNFPYKSDKENKPFYHFYFSAICMFLFPQLIPGRKQKRFYEVLLRFTSLQNINKVKVRIEKLPKVYPTYDLTTTTGTFICENFLVHNCWMEYSRDQQALEDLNNGLDIHKLIAAVAYHDIKLPRDAINKETFLELTKDVTKAERQDTKTIVFGVMYGRGAPSVAAQLGISTSKARKIIDVFFSRYPQASFWIKTTIATTRRDGYTVNLFGRRRRLPDILSPIQGVRAAAERQAINAPIQSGASDLTFLAGGRIFRHIWQNRMKTRLVLTVYDSLVFNIPDNELKTIVDLVSVEMIKKPLDSIMVPIGCEIKVGTHWGTLMEINPKEDWNIVYNKLIEHKKLKDVKFTQNKRG
jgi:uracil-DNA glycosylase family 4